MTPSIIENWTRVRGVLEGSRLAQQPGHLTIRLHLESVDAVKGYPSLLRAAPNDVIEMLVPTSAGRAVDWQPGMRLEGLVRRAGVDRIYAHPESFGPQRPEG